MARNLFTQDPLSRAMGLEAPKVRGAIQGEPAAPAAPAAPAPGASPREVFDSIGSNTGLPPNLVWAIGERVSENGMIDPVKVSAAAADLSRAVKETGDIGAALKAWGGEEADALLTRSYDIADEHYPTPEQIERDERRNDNFAATDLALGFGGGVVEGAGMMLSGAGRAFKNPNREDGGVPFLSAAADALDGLFTGAGESVEGLGKAIQSGTSDRAQQAQDDSRISGNLFEPSSWDFGEKPSLLGMGMMAANVFGNLVPVVVAGVATGGAGAALAGGTQSMESGSDTARAVLEEAAANGTLQEESAYYKKLRAEGMDEAKALERTIAAGEKMGGIFAAPLGAFGGAATSALAKGAAGNIVGGGMAQRVAGGAALGAAEEGVQEAAEGVSTRVGAGLAAEMGLDPLEDTFGDFVMGAIAGAPMGAAGGVADPNAAPDAPLPPEPEAEPEAGPGALPAPTGPAGYLPPPSDAERVRGAIPDMRTVRANPADGDPGYRFPALPNGTDIPLYHQNGEGFQSRAGQDPAAEPGQGFRNATAPRGPLEAAERMAPAPVVDEAAPEAPAPMFPDQKPGAEVKLRAPDGNDYDAVFLREDESGVVVRIDGQEVGLDPAEFDRARREAGKPQPKEGGAADAALKGAQTPARPATPGLPESIEETDRLIAVARSQGSASNGGMRPAIMDRINLLTQHRNRLVQEQAEDADVVEDIAPEVDEGAEPVDETTVSPASGADQVDTAPEVTTPVPNETTAPEPEAPAEVTTKTGKPFADERAAKRGLKSRGLDADAYRIEPRDGGFVAVPAVAQEETDAGLDADPVRDDAPAAEPVAAGQPAAPGATDAPRPGDAAAAEAEPTAQGGSEGLNPLEAVKAEMDAWSAEEKAKNGGRPANMKLETLQRLAREKKERAEDWRKAAAAESEAEQKRMRTVADRMEQHGKNAEFLASLSDAQIQKLDRNLEIADIHPGDNGLDPWKAREWIEDALNRPENADNGNPAPTAAEIDAAAAEANPEPTPGQAAAGNYKKGRTKVHGFDVAIETAKGSERRGTAPDGREWSVTMPAHYGDLKGTKGADGDPLDVYLGPNLESDTVLVVDQIDPETGTFDEHKIVMGFDSGREARATYVAGFSDGSGESRIGGATKMTVEQFKEWVKSGDHKKPAGEVEAAKKADPETPKVAPNREEVAPADLTTVTDLYGGKHRVHPDDLASSRPMLPTYDTKGRKAEGTLLNRENIGADGTGVTATYAEDSYFVKKDGTPFADEKAARRAVKGRFKQNPEDFEFRKVDGGVVAVRKAASEAAPDAPKAEEPKVAPKPEDRTFPGGKLWGGLTWGQVIRNHVEAHVSGGADTSIREDAQERLWVVAFGGRSAANLKQRIPNDLTSFARDLLASAGGTPHPLKTTYSWSQKPGQDPKAFGKDGFVSLEEARNAEPAPASESTAPTANETTTSEAETADPSPAPENAQEPEALRLTGPKGADLARITVAPDDNGGFVGGYDYEVSGLAGGGGSGAPAATEQEATSNAAQALRRTVRGIAEGRAGSAATDAHVATAQRIMGWLDEVAPEATSPQPEAPSAAPPEAQEEATTGPEPDAPAEQPVSPAPATEPATPPRGRAEKIDDFGEKIEGAAKDLRGAYAESLEDVPDADLAAEPLSKSFPQPDYQKLLDDGVDPWAVAFIHAARDQIPAKPRVAWRAKSWAAQVQVLRDFSRGLMDGTFTPEQVQAKMRGQPTLMYRMGGPVALYLAVGHGTSLKGMEFREREYSMLEGVRHDPPLKRWEVTRTRKATAFSNMPHIMAMGKTREEALAAFTKEFDPEAAAKKAKAPRKFAIYRYRGREGYFIGTKVGSTMIDLAQAEDVAAARKVVAEQADELESTFQRLRDTPSERRSTNAPRVGADHRKGQHVTPEEFSERFGFRGVQFGNWVENDRRQADLNEAYDALMDLAGVVGVEPEALSLNGELGLAFGARGKGGVGAGAAHYEPTQVVINLTKKNGAGSLAHEWFHALDNYFERGRGRKSGYMTDNNKPTEDGTPVREEVIEAFRTVRRAIQKTDMPKRSKEMDKTRTKPYWSQMIEMGARAFENFVIAKLQDQNGANDYLANVVDEAAFEADSKLQGYTAPTYPYATEAEMAVIKPAFQSLFDVIETKQTDRGVAMYRRRPPNAEPIMLDDGVDAASASSPVGDAGARLDADAAELNVEIAPAADKPGATTSGATAIREALSEQLRKAGLAGKAALRFADALTDPEGRALDGTAAGRVITVALDALDAAATLDHEIIHVLRDRTNWGQPYGLFTQDEWRSLVRAARADKDRMADIERRYPDLSESARIEEAVAEMYAEYQAGQRKPGVIGAMKRIAATLKAIGRALTGQGLTSPEAVMRAIGRGEIGGRGPDGPSGPGGAPKARRRGFSDAFKRWFGESKVVDKNGEPLVVYHGTRAPEFDAFEGEIFFFGDAETADDYAVEAFAEGEPRVIGAYLRMERPASEADVFRLAGQENDGESLAFEYLDSDVIAALKREGFDGVILDNEASPSRPGETVTSWAVFQPEQIKSVDNDGGFDPTDPRMKARRRADPPRDRGGRFSAANNWVRSLPIGAKAWRKDGPALWSDMLTDAMGGAGSLKLGRIPGTEKDVSIPAVNLLGTVPGRALFSELGKGLASARVYLHLKEEMDALRNEWHGRMDKVAQDWLELQGAKGFPITPEGRKKRAEAKSHNAALMDLMHKATLAQVDPSKPFEAGDYMTEQEADAAKAKWRELRAAFGKLPEPYRKQFVTVRDAYSQLADEYEKAILDNVQKAADIAAKQAERDYEKEVRRVRDEGLTGDAKAEALAIAQGRIDETRSRAKATQQGRIRGLRDVFEANRLKGPYFPLARFGQYFVTLRDSSGKVVSFSRFENREDQRDFAKEKRAEGYGVQTGVLSEDPDLKSKVDPRFVADIEGVLGDAGASIEVMDAVWQKWLETLPDQSIRTSRIHRKGTEGYAKDALRSFTSHVFHGSHQLARLKYSLDMDEALNEAELEAARQKDPVRAGLIVNEMRKRHAFAMNPTGAAWTATVTSAAFIWYLGATPAAAIVNISQTSVMGPAILGARFKGGVTGAVKELGRASADVGRASGKDLKDWAKGIESGDGALMRSKRLNKHEKAAVQEALRRGTIDKTQAHDLASVAETGIEYSGKREAVMRKIGFFFHEAEVFNRTATFLAAYRMAKADGMSHEEAIDVGADATWKTHFDYQSCVDEETECLTMSGWKKWHELRPGDRILSTDDGGKAVEVGVQEVNVHQRAQEITLFQARGPRRFSMAVTDNHKCVVVKETKKGGERGWTPPHFLEARGVDQRHHLQRVPLAPIDRPDSIGIDMAALIGWFTAEGWYAKNRGAKSKNNVRIEQSQIHNPDHVEAIDGILERLGGGFSRHIVKGGRHVLWSLSGKIAKEVQTIAPDKLLTWDLFAKLSAPEMAAMLDAFVKADGSLKGKNGCICVSQKASTNLQNLDVLQAMATALGKSTSLGLGGTRDSAHLTMPGSGRIQTAKTAIANLEKSRVEVPMVWCPTTDNGRWIARRDGCVFVTGNSSRPRFMQADFPKVLTIFRQFSVNMLFRLARDLHQTFNGDTPEARREAKTQFIAMSLSMMAHAGIKGVWGYGIITTLLGMFFPGGDDDVDRYLQDALLLEGESVGATAWNYAMGAVLNGIPGQLTGTSLTQRLGMPNLWFRDQSRDLEATDWYETMAIELLGPAYGIGEGIARGAWYAGQGEWWRGVEAGTPKIVRDVMRAGRYAVEGVQTRHGDPLVEDVGVTGVIKQAMGFTPADVAERYDQNNRMKNMEIRISDERRDIQGDIAKAIMKGETVPDRLWARMAEFNRTYPEWPITGDTIRQSIQGRQRASERNEFGVSLNPKLNARIRSGEAPLIYG